MSATQMQWLESSEFSDDLLIQLKMPELCSAERSEGYDTLMSALAYLPIQQRLAPTARLTALTHELTEKPLLPRVPAPADLDLAATYQRDYGWPLPEAFIKEANAQKKAYYELLSKVVEGDKPTLAKVGLGAEYSLTAQQQMWLKEQMTHLAQMDSLKDYATAVKKQGDFIAYRSEWLPTADHWLNQVLTYLNRSEKALAKNSQLVWSDQDKKRRAQIAEGLQNQKMKVQALHQQMHESIVARLNQASEVYDPSFLDVYTVLRKNVSLKLQCDYELVCSTLTQLKKTGWLSVPKPLNDSAKPRPSHDASIFNALHQSLHTSPYAGLTPLQCSWLQVDTQAAIPMAQVQTQTRWLIPQVLRPWVPSHPPGFFSWLGSYFAYQLPGRYALMLAFINSHMHRLNTIFDAWCWQPPEALTAEPIGPTLQQVEQGVSLLRIHLQAQKRSLLWRWLCYLLADRQTRCINALLNVCETLEKKTLLATRQRWLREVLQRYEDHDYAPNLEDQQKFSTELSTFPIILSTDKDEKISLNSRWQAVCEKPIQPREDTTPKGNQRPTLEDLKSIDPHLDQIIAALPSLLQQTAQASKEVSRLKKAMRSSEQANTEVELPRLSWDEVETVLQSSHAPIAQAFKALTAGHLVNESTEEGASIEPETLVAYYRPALSCGFAQGAEAEQQHEARFAHAALMQLNKRLRQALAILPNFSMNETQLAQHSRWIVLAVRTLKAFNTLESEPIWAYRMEKILYRYAQSMQRFHVSSVESSRCKVEQKALTAILNVLGQESHQRLWQQMYAVWHSSDQEKKLDEVTSILAHLVQRKRFLHHVEEFNHCSTIDNPKQESSTALSQKKQEQACLQWLEQQCTKVQNQTIQTAQSWAHLFHQTHTHLACDVFGKTVLNKARNIRHKELFHYHSYDFQPPQ